MPYRFPAPRGLTIPELDVDICIGCGACEHACPVWPHRAIFVEGESVHKVAQMPKNEEPRIPLNLRHDILEALLLRHSLSV